MLYKADFGFSPPWMNAAGMLGFFPDPRQPEGWQGLGAFLTNPLSLGARTPAQPERWVAYPGGVLLHNGYPNPGLDAAIRQYARRWQESSVPVIVSILAHTPPEVRLMMDMLEAIDGLAGVELGLPPGIEPAQAVELARAAAGELAVMPRLPFENALDVAQALKAAGVEAVSLGAPRGALPGRHGRILHGRLYGPSVLPFSLAMTRQLAGLGLMVVASGGIMQPADARSLLDAGAAAVQIDVALWRAGWPGV